MKYLKLFEQYERFSTHETEFNGVKFKVIDSSPNNTDGMVQIDTVVLEINGDEFYFEMATLVDGYVVVTYTSGEQDKDFTRHFNLIVDERVENEDITNIFYDLTDKPKEMVGEEYNVDNFTIKISDFSHDGGYEFGSISALIDGQEIDFEMKQDATGSNMDYDVTYMSEEDEELGKKYKFDLESNEIQDHLFSEYDRITGEKYR